MKISLSFCEFQNGTFDLYIEGEQGQQVTLTGKSDLISNEDKIFLSQTMPPCVRTKYQSVE